MIIILLAYIGPYFYYKIIQKKSFNPQKNIGVKHAIWYADESKKY